MGVLAFNMPLQHAYLAAAQPRASCGPMRAGTQLRAVRRGSPAFPTSAHSLHLGEGGDRYIGPLQRHGLSGVRPRRLPRQPRRFPVTRVTATGAAGAVVAAWGKAAAVANVVAIQLGASAATITAYLPFLPAAAATAAQGLQSVPLPSLDVAGAAACAQLYTCMAEVIM